MHELSVMSYLLESVEEQAQLMGASKVVTINLVIGERAGILDDSLLFYFDMLTPDTLAAGARLHVRRTEMRFYCESCNLKYARVGDDFRCPHCHTVGQVTDDGSEFLIESIVVEMENQ